MIDVARLRKELEYITAHPEEWDQSTWGRRTTRSCGTVACLAGNTVLHADEEVVWELGRMIGVNDGQSIPERARELLGLNEVEAEDLFAGGNSLRMLWRMASRFTDGEIQVPEDLPEWADADPWTMTLTRPWENGGACSCERQETQA
jgi:hypothetical protein